MGCRSHSPLPTDDAALAFLCVVWVPLGCSHAFLHTDVRRPVCRRPSCPQGRLSRVPLLSSGAAGRRCRSHGAVRVSRVSRSGSPAGVGAAVPRGCCCPGGGGGAAGGSKRDGEVQGVDLSTDNRLYGGECRFIFAQLRTDWSVFRRIRDSLANLFLHCQCDNASNMGQSIMCR